MVHNHRAQVRWLRSVHVVPIRILAIAVVRWRAKQMTGLAGGVLLLRKPRDAMEGRRGSRAEVRALRHDNVALSCLRVACECGCGRWHPVRGGRLHNRTTVRWWASPAAVRAAAERGADRPGLASVLADCSPVVGGSSRRARPSADAERFGALSDGGQRRMESCWAGSVAQRRPGVRRVRRDRRARGWGRTPRLPRSHGEAVDVALRWSWSSGEVGGKGRLVGRASVERVRPGEFAERGAVDDLQVEGSAPARRAHRLTHSLAALVPSRAARARRTIAWSFDVSPPIMKARGTGEPTVGNGKRERPQPVVLAGNRPIGGEAVRGRQGAARDLPPRRTSRPSAGRSPRSVAAPP